MALLFFQKTIFTPLYGLNSYVIEVINSGLTQIACHGRHGLWLRSITCLRKAIKCLMQTTKDWLTASWWMSKSLSSTICTIRSIELLWKGDAFLAWSEWRSLEHLISRCYRMGIAASSERWTAPDVRALGRLKLGPEPRARDMYIISQPVLEEIARSMKQLIWLDQH